MIIISEPRSPVDFARYYDLRWSVLREPWGRPRGSEKDEWEETSTHLMASNEEGAAVGVGRVHFPEPKTAWIRFMAVDERFRGRGIGRAILERLERIARSKGAVLITLNSREAVVDFYRKSGYSIVGDGPTLFGQIRHVTMAKNFPY